MLAMDRPRGLLVSFAACLQHRELPPMGMLTSMPGSLTTHPHRSQRHVRLAASCAALGLCLCAAAALGQSAPDTTPTNSPAQPAPAAAGPRPLDLAALVAEALDRNPSLAAMRLKREAMDQERRLARAFANPFFAVENMNEAGKLRFPDSPETRLGIEQPIAGWGKRHLRGEVAQRAAEVMGHEYLAMCREVTAMVKETYYELYAVQKAQAIARAEDELIKRLVKAAETRYATGAVTQQDVLKAQTEGAMLRARLFEWEAREAALRARLNALLHRAPDAAVGRAATPPRRWALGSRAPLTEQAVKHRSEVRAAEVTTLRDEAVRQLAGQEYFPDFSAGLQYVFVAQENDMMNLMLGVELPLWGRRNRALLDQADLQLQSGQAALAATRSRVQADVGEAWAALHAAQKTLDLYEKELLPQADARFRASESAYSAGKADFMDLLESERFLLEARLMQAMAEGDLGTRQARLERAVGRDLP
jgi:cobalt-zinc-cadmium efflux system outer membrane protein